ncbi:MAG: hypothetical protein V1789_04970 [PVC group bacterium]
MNHTAIENAIKTDIIRKNTLLKKIRRMNRRGEEYRQLAANCRNRRHHKKYLATAARYSAELNRLRPVARELVEDLDGRLHEELAFSVKEVNTFKGQLREEKAEVEDISAKLEEVEGKLHADQERCAGEIKAGKKTPGPGKLKERLEKEKAEDIRLKKQKEMEEKRVAGLEKELAAEETDRKIFKGELSHMEAEKKILKKDFPGPAPEG